MTELKITELRNRERIADALETLLYVPTHAIKQKIVWRIKNSQNLIIIQVNFFGTHRVF
jgi:hypothetical protein